MVSPQNTFEIIRNNKELVEKYPFLLPRDYLTDEIPPDYDYTYTELDEMPDGWKIAFGERMCEEIRNELVKESRLDKYRVLQIKEKYGELCWYDYGGTDETAYEIIPKYRKLSKYTCVRCGKPATKLTLGWICPYCDDCVPATEFYEKIEPDEEYEALEIFNPAT